MHALRPHAAPLATLGLRFVRRVDGSYWWVPARLMHPTDVDVSHMSDADFERLIGSPLPRVTS